MKPRFQENPLRNSEIDHLTDVNQFFPPSLISQKLNDEKRSARMKEKKTEKREIFFFF